MYAHTHIIHVKTNEDNSENVKTKVKMCTAVLEMTNQ